MKVTAIQEAHDISYIKVKKLIISLLTFEMAIYEEFKKKSKGVSFKADMEDSKEQEEKDIDNNFSMETKCLLNYFTVNVPNNLTLPSRKYTQNNHIYCKT